MKPAPFTYHAPATEAALLDLTEQFGADSRVLAGGQSLMPLLNMRQVRVGHLIDLNGVAGLDHLDVDDDALVIGALVRHADALASSLVRDRAPLVTDALAFVASPTVRNRGTPCGSIAFAQPGAELPAAALALGGSVVAVSVSGTRRIPVDDFFVAPFVTALRPSEVIRELRLACWPAATGHAFVEVSRLGWPVVGAAALVERTDDTVSRCAVAVTGLAGVPLRMSGVEATVTGTMPDGDEIEQAIRADTDAVDARETVHGSSSYHRHVARVVVRRAVTRAVDRARGGTR